jgi:hypothetical protein
MALLTNPPSCRRLVLFVGPRGPVKHFPKLHKRQYCAVLRSGKVFWQVGGLETRETTIIVVFVVLTFASTQPNEIGTANPAREVGACPENPLSNQMRFTQQMMRKRWARGRVRAAMSSEEAKNKDGRDAFGKEPLCVAQTSPSFPAASCHCEECVNMK